MGGKEDWNMPKRQRRSRTGESNVAKRRRKQVPNRFHSFWPIRCYACLTPPSCRSLPLLAEMSKFIENLHESSWIVNNLGRILGESWKNLERIWRMLKESWENLQKASRIFKNLRELSWIIKNHLGLLRILEESWKNLERILKEFRRSGCAPGCHPNIPQDFWPEFREHREETRTHLHNPP